jgi:hypothetical protein
LKKGTTWIGVGCPSNVRPSSVASAIERGLDDRRQVALPSGQVDVHDLPDRRQQRRKACRPSPITRTRGRDAAQSPC